MFSAKWPEAFGPDAEQMMLEAATAVAERSFFEVVERCDEEKFADLAGDCPRWLVATVPFAAAGSEGAVSCTFSEELTLALFDGFTGREPLGAPRGGELVDLVGEFANMLCGSWLTRMNGAAGFTLSPPTVGWADGSAPTPAGPHLLLAVNDLPLVVQVRTEAGAGA